jgi:hypothetical protein
VPIAGSVSIIIRIWLILLHGGWLVIVFQSQGNRLVPALHPEVADQEP